MSFNTLQKTYQAIHDKVQRLLCIVKEHNVSITPQNVKAKSPSTKRLFITTGLPVYAIRTFNFKRINNRGEKIWQYQKENVGRLWGRGTINCFAGALVGGIVRNKHFRVVGKRSL